MLLGSRLARYVQDKVCLSRAAFMHPSVTVLLQHCLLGPFQLCLNPAAGLGHMSGWETMPWAKPMLASTVTPCLVQSHQNAVQC